MRSGTIPSRAHLPRLGLGAVAAGLYVPSFEPGHAEHELTQTIRRSKVSREHDLQFAELLAATATRRFPDFKPDLVVCVPERPGTGGSLPDYPERARHPARSGGRRSRAQADELAVERLDHRKRHLDSLPGRPAPLEQALRRLARRQSGCRALMAHYGIGELTAPTILCELGDVTRLSASRKAVRCAGLDVGVHRSDRRSRAGKLTRQGSPQLRWALYESAQAACRPTSPDRADYLALKARGLSHTRASLTIARKLARRCFHTLRELGPEALEPVA
jgi:hypothetical protein